MTAMTRWTYMVVLAFAVSGTTVAVADDADLDYQRLVGTWEWSYPVGNSTLTLVEATKGVGQVALKGFYKPCPPACGAGRGMPLSGIIELQKEKQEVVLTLVNGSKIYLWWNGNTRLWGNAILQAWSGDVDFHKKN